MIESHHLVYLSKRGKPQFVVTIESDRKHFHQHTGLQYEIDFVHCSQKNVVTGYVRRLLRRDLVYTAIVRRHEQELGVGIGVSFKAAAAASVCCCIL
jgi:hypothetical protein